VGKNFIYSLDFGIDKYQNIQERKVKTIFEMLSDVGGLFGILNPTVAYFIAPIV